MQDFISLIIKSLSNISLWSILDILVVSYIFYKGYMLIKETRAEQLLKGIALIIVLIPISYLLKLDMLYFILNKTLTIGVLSVIIIFQPEIRRGLEHIGRSAFEDVHYANDKESINIAINEIVNAVHNLSETKTGALIVMEQKTGLAEIVSSGTILDANVSSNLLENIFVVNTPLHDGATIIRNNKILASGCVLPLTNNNNINKKLGTRHRAGLGLSEVSDALIIIVSEETGVVSLAINGKLSRGYDKERLRNILSNIIENRNKNKKNVKDAKERVRSWVRGIKINH
ncbi:TIGR00159 family protein [Clostridium botulinum]|uniref:diadenylate cyclase CdaA n=1 Tax=Clostridium TaxID=1485 RepID=UPI00050814E3|nr:MULTISPECIES: diadenylate cyclase CdaA [unclassified Clostridium]AIY80725.1 disA bacterial checkpoint controller nucleotide-binding family protein [Clostridium botulinum 202F]KAI3345494.1 diadenylate cyclase CdaA [Clostridium botulinum]KFX55172.1 membrane protein [Clostridium botulinum]KFX56433.1 membrane protein [Clostridium botulinum]KON11830.1 membrane protein [Clostridium botulinum]